MTSNTDKSLTIMHTVGNQERHNLDLYVRNTCLPSDLSVTIRRSVVWVGNELGSRGAGKSCFWGCQFKMIQNRENKCTENVLGVI